MSDCSLLVVSCLCPQHSLLDVLGLCAIGLAAGQDDFSLLARHVNHYALLSWHSAFAWVPTVVWTLAAAFARPYVVLEALQWALMVLIALVALAAVAAAAHALAQSVRKNQGVDPLLH